jgi:hypothetical protein
MGPNTRKQWRLIIGSAVLGFVVTVLIVLYIYLLGEFQGNLYTAFAVVCPPSLAVIPLSGAMKDKVSSVAVWSLIGLSNAGLYAIVGAAVGGLLWKPD